MRTISYAIVLCLAHKSLGARQQSYLDKWVLRQIKNWNNFNLFCDALADKLTEIVAGLGMHAGFDFFACIVVHICQCTAIQSSGLKLVECIPENELDRTSAYYEKRSTDFIDLVLNLFGTCF